MSEEIRAALARLQDRGWTLAAIADELGVSWETVRRWRDKERETANERGVLEVLSRLERRRRVPKKRRYRQEKGPPQPES